MYLPIRWSSSIVTILSSTVKWSGWWPRRSPTVGSERSLRVWSGSSRSWDALRRIRWRPPVTPKDVVGSLHVWTVFFKRRSGS